MSLSKEDLEAELAAFAKSDKIAPAQVGDNEDVEIHGARSLFFMIRDIIYFFSSFSSLFLFLSLLSPQYRATSSLLIPSSAINPKLDLWVY